MLFAVAVFVSAAVMSLGAFATIAHADGWDSYDSFGGGWDSYDSYGGSWDSYDTYSGGWDSYDTYGGGWDSYDSYGGDWNSYDTYSGGTWEEYNPGYYEEYNSGSYEEYNPGYYEEYNSGSYEEYNPGYYEEYTPEYVDSYMDQYAAGNPMYSTGGSFGGFGSMGGFSMPTFTTGGGYHYQTPSYPTPGCTKNCYPTPGCTSNCFPTPGCTKNCNPQPTTPCTTCGGSNVTNINTNTNTNTWIDNSITDNSINIDNSIRDSFNTTVIGDGNIVAGGYQGIAIGGQVATAVAAAPYCVITLTNAGVYNTQATLVWSSSNAQSAYIMSVGAVAPNGTRVVTGYANQIYSLTVTGQGGSYTCQTQMFTPTYVPPAPITPSVSLTQIPYTGLDLGPVGNAMYWLSLISVAAAGGYLLTYYKGGALALMGAAMTRRQNHFVVSEQEAEEVSAPEVEVAEEVAAPVATFSLPTMAVAKTRDAMQMIRNADGMPQIIIARA